MSSALSLSNVVGVGLAQDNIQSTLSNTTYVGIDFGTSTTTISYSIIGNGDVPIETYSMSVQQLLEDGRLYESHLVPTVIAWYKEQLFIGVGASSLKGQLQQGINLWASFKMGLGEDLGSVYYNSKLPTGHPIATIEKPLDAARVFFSFLKNQIEDYIEQHNLPSRIRYSVSVPASFESNQRASLLSALSNAGIELEGKLLIDEPNAAFLSYLAESSLNGLGSLNIPESSPLQILVFDWGAGTLDVSILEIARSETGGLTCKNLAISKFTALGGDDIDKRIVTDILLPQLFKQNNCSIDDFRSADLSKRIIPKLQKTAEELKILACKSVSSQMVSNRLPSIATSNERLELNRSIDIDLPTKKLNLLNPSMSYSEFNEVMDSFFVGAETGDISVFAPIESSLRKGELNNSDLDLILFIGGSSSNPYVQVALANYFTGVEIEIPRDLRCHVSQGAAVNSLLLNGLGLTLVRPIVSEPILLITRNGLQTLIAAGTEISRINKEFDFCTGDNEQEKIQIPLCVGNENKILTVITIDADIYSETFAPNTWVRVNCRLSEDKVLSVTASIDGNEVVSTLINPFANRELTTEERLVFKAEKMANEMAAQNGGKPAVPELLYLVEACVEAKDYLRAAETLELVQMLDKNKRYETNIGCYYAWADKQKQALAWSQKAYEKEASAVNAANLALSYYRNGDNHQYESLMEKSLSLDQNFTFTLVSYGRYLMAKEANRRARGREMVQRAFDSLYKLFLDNNLYLLDYHKLIDAAELLGKNDVVKVVKMRQLELNTKAKFYDEDSLLASQIGSNQNINSRLIPPSNSFKLF
ncbi:molecular chaperone DnaK [Dulcicalothrix desertica PCC 7102]|uniref:Molecular chaperone DnaK n=1 Tax=Dulcicalothrix desertica PCC 7102 TaxID=232991 RepID=A0A433VD27_9CYAN|nr:Hsp70 family protein [Dulcicalothrix desertica]RUT03994.1 molecular chaperone DnaK [Dulcicalothrix desertica PCC 7102]TWH43600.1 molecular chaperone DnaK (HSP70) [Dulcicalothrix desertica PCC 7102]